MTYYRFCQGFFTPFVQKGWLIGVGAVLLGLWLGSKVYKKIPMEGLRKAVYIFIGIIGIAALLNH